jgi:hypothetical protein
MNYRDRTRFSHYETTNNSYSTGDSPHYRPPLAGARAQRAASVKSWTEVF